MITALLELDLTKPGFDDYEEFGRISVYIAKSSKIQTEESLIDAFLKRLQELELKSNLWIKSKCLK